MKFDPARMTVRDLNDFYDIVGVEWEDMADEKGNLVMPKGKSHKVLLALAFIAGRKEDKSFTMEDALDVELTNLMGLSVEEDEADPLEETPAPSETTSDDTKPDTDESSSNSESPTSST